MTIRKRTKHYPGQIREAVSQMNDMRTGGLLYDLLNASAPVYENDAQLRQKALNFPKPAISAVAIVSAVGSSYPLVPVENYRSSAKAISDLGAIMARGHQEIPAPEAMSGMSDVLSWEASTHAIRTQLSAEDEKRRSAMSAVPLLPYNSPIRAGLTSDVAKKIEKQRIAKDAIRFAERAEVGKQADDLIKSMSGGKMPPAQKNAQIDTTAKGIEKAFKKGSTIRQLRKGLAITVASGAVSSLIGQEFKAAQYGQNISNAAILTGTDPETMAKWSYALRTVGGSEASATKLFGGINNLLQGALMGESSPYFKVADKYGLKLTGHGQGGLATEQELLDRLGEFFRTETSGRKKAHLASILGFDAATIRLFSMSQSDLNKRLNDDFAFSGDEIKVFEDEQMRINEKMIQFENSLMRAVHSLGLFDAAVKSIDLATGFANVVKDISSGIRTIVNAAKNPNSPTFNEFREHARRRMFGPDDSDFFPSQSSVSARDIMLLGSSTLLNNNLWPDTMYGVPKSININIKGELKDPYGNLMRTDWSASPDHAIRVNIQ